MNTYHIPKGNRTDKQYFEYCETLPWTYNADWVISVDPAKEYVTLDGSITGFDLVDVSIIPAQPVTISKIGFMNRFTNTELATILTVAKTNVGVEVFVKKLDLADTVTINGPDAIEGVNALESGGLLAIGRAAEILTT